MGLLLGGQLVMRTRKIREQPGFYHADIVDKEEVLGDVASPVKSASTSALVAVQPKAVNLEDMTATERAIYDKEQEALRFEENMRFNADILARSREVARVEAFSPLGRAHGRVRHVMRMRRNSNKAEQFSLDLGYTRGEMATVQSLVAVKHTMAEEELGRHRQVQQSQAQVRTARPLVSNLILDGCVVVLCLQRVVVSPLCPRSGRALVRRGRWRISSANASCTSTALLARHRVTTRTTSRGCPHLRRSRACTLRRVGRSNKSRAATPRRSRR